MLSKCEVLRVYPDVLTDKGKNQWKEIADLPQPLISPMSIGYKEHVYVFGGMMKNKERYKGIVRYEQDQNNWVKLDWQFQFGIEASSIFSQPDSNEFIIFGGRVVNGDSNGIWKLTMLDK